MSMHPKDLLIKDFTYYLPDDRIAKYPLEKRDESKLLIYKKGNIAEDIFVNLDRYIPRNSMLIFNDTKVVEARLLFRKSIGTEIEIFCLEPANEFTEITTALLQKEKLKWKCLVGGAKKWKQEILVKEIDHENGQLQLSAKKIENLPDSVLIEFAWDNDALCFSEVLHLAGFIPLPPYLKRAAEKKDIERYQTIYAKSEGSVAAPTAGLHFSKQLFKKLKEKKITRSFVTLHVGAGTFMPVKSETMDQHDMHAEFIDVKMELIEKILYHAGKKVIAVGTTSLRTIESLYWMGVKTISNPGCSMDNLYIEQWYPYEYNGEKVSQTKALKSLVNWMKRNSTDRIIAKTKIIIAPGYTLKIADALITNFHQPQSTLLLLVAAIAGDNWKTIYAYALENNFRFLSYGDGSIIWPKK